MIKKKCLTPHCFKLIGLHDKHCKEHSIKKTVVRERANDAFYSSKKWRHLRSSFLNHNPLCANCDKYDQITAATVVDHIKEIKEGGNKLEWNNLQALCVSCHNRKTNSNRERIKKLKQPPIKKLKQPPTQENLQWI